VVLFVMRTKCENWWGDKTQNQLNDTSGFSLSHTLKTMQKSSGAPAFLTVGMPFEWKANPTVKSSAFVGSNFASIAWQNLIRLVPVICGLSGTKSAKMSLRL
jgi:hypothetical protein